MRRGVGSGSTKRDSGKIFPFDFMPDPTLRSLAKSLRLSHSTISAALRNSPLVTAKTKARVRAAAEAAGYRRNPLAGALMSELRRTRGRAFRGVIGVVILHEPERPAHGDKFFDQQIRGARARAEELGFTLEIFIVGDGHLTFKRLESILQARGISGLMLMPAWWDPNFNELDWSRYAGVYSDYIIEEPPLHSICPDHYRSMTDALVRLQQMGYRRPGLFVPRRHNDRLQNRWEGAFLAFQRNNARTKFVPPLTAEEISRENFSAWFRRHDPDVVLGHQIEAMKWMTACGASIPKTHGFFCLNLIMTRAPCAGFNQLPDFIGARAIDIVTAQLYRNEFGVPKRGVLTTIPSLFVEGPTIRTIPPPRARRA